MLNATEFWERGRSRTLLRASAAMPLIWSVGCVAVGIGLLLGSGHSIREPAPGRSAAGATEVEHAHCGSEARLEYTPIESIRVGQRVITPQQDGTCRVGTEVDPRTWKKVTLQMVRVWEDGMRDDCQIQTLQPPAWLAAHDVRLGSRVPLPVDLSDLAEPDIPAEVLAVEPCPPIGDGPGRVVLTTVNHLNSFLFGLTVRDSSGEERRLGVTGWHKLLSESRGWVSTCELGEGEVLRGREGPVSVVSLVREPGTYRVYNMTVEGEHVYYVSALDLLAHNNNCNNNPRLRREWEQSNQEPWPKDPNNPTRNQDVSHIVPKADGGADALHNIEPLPRDDHMQRHITNGDFRRWGARGGGNGT